MGFFSFKSRFCVLYFFVFQFFFRPINGLLDGVRLLQVNKKFSAVVKKGVG